MSFLMIDTMGRMIVSLFEALNSERRARERQLYLILVSNPLKYFLDLFRSDPSLQTHEDRARFNPISLFALFKLGFLYLFIFWYHLFCFITLTIPLSSQIPLRLALLTGPSFSLKILTTTSSEPLLTLRQATSLPLSQLRFPAQQHDSGYHTRSSLDPKADCA